MKVFVVTSGSYSDYGIVAIFSLKDKAHAYCNNNPHQDLNGVDEWELDEKQDVLERQYWETRIGTDIKANNWGAQYGKLKSTGPHFMSAKENQRSEVSDDYGQIIAKSFESLEHSIKLAEEAWQKHLVKEAGI